MRTIRRLIYREVVVSVAFVTLAFLALFFFFDLVDELRWVGGWAGYQLTHALLFVALGMPSHLYELLPITVLIGTIFVMAGWQSSEFTIMRTSGLGPGGAAHPAGAGLRLVCSPSPWATTWLRSANARPPWSRRAPGPDHHRGHGRLAQGAQGDHSFAVNVAPSSDGACAGAHLRVR
jgi:lipopolysaccharide export system permease protein